MSESFFHGVNVEEISEGVRPITSVNTAVIGVPVWADDADATVFPENTSVLINDPLSIIDKAGDSGNLAATLDAISDHGRTQTVLVRVPEGADAAELETNIIGGSVNGKYTGMKALLSANTNLGVTPKILGVPGADSQAVTAEMATIAKQLNGFLYASCYGAETKEAAVAYRDNFGDRELMLLWPDFKSGANSINAVARAMGLRAQIDREVGWHKTLSNVTVAGVTGITKDISWSLTDSATDANYLNENEVTAIIRQDGYRFWGNRTCSADPLFAFESYTRTAQVMKATLSEAQLWAMALPLHKSLARDIVSSINAKISNWVANGYLIGGNAWVDPAKNTAAELKAGKLRISYDYTPVPPLENLALEQRTTDTYLLNFASGLAA